MKYIVGIDASWLATGLAFVPEDGKKPWVSSACTTIKAPKKKFENDSARLNYIVDQIIAFCAGSRATVARPIARSEEISGIYIEDFFGGMGVKPLGRLRGAIDHEVWRIMNIEVQPVNVGAARKLLLGPVGRLERKEAKRIVLSTWQAAGAPVVDDAQADAMTIANYALHLRGKPCLKK